MSKINFSYQQGETPSARAWGLAARSEPRKDSGSPPETVGKVDPPAAPDTKRSRASATLRGFGFVAALALCAGIGIAADPAEAANAYEIIAPQEKLDGKDRFALVIGNSAYRNVPTLRNPLNDAVAIGERLNRLGFEVMLSRDADRRGMNETIGTFLARLTPGAEVVFYYAGHGVEVQGANQLLPIDVPKLQAGQDRLLRAEAINLSELLIDLREKAPRALVMIIDACRDNPFSADGTRGVGSTRGLARVEPPKGSLVVYSAGVGEKALDSTGEDDKNPNSVFTRSLLRVMNEEAVEIRDMVRRVRGEVREAALRVGGHQQTPGYYDELLDDFYFKPKLAVDANVAFCERNVDGDAEPVSLLRRNLEPLVQACGRAMSAVPGDEKLSRLFLTVTEQRAFQNALNSDAPDAGLTYLALFPSGRYGAIVRDHLGRTKQASSSRPAAATASEPDRTSEKVAALRIEPLSASEPTASRETATGTLNVHQPASSASTEDPFWLRRELQSELKRLGCYAGEADGHWGSRAKASLAAFNRHARTRLPEEPQPASLEALRKRTDRVCAPACARGEQAVGDRCVRIACKRGEKLDADGECAPVRAAPKTKAAKAAAPPKREAATPARTRAVRRRPVEVEEEAYVPRRARPREPVVVQQAAPPVHVRPAIGIGVGLGGFRVGF